MKNSLGILIAVGAVVAVSAIASAQAEPSAQATSTTNQGVVKGKPAKNLQPKCAANVRTFDLQSSDHISTRGQNNHPGGGILPTQKLWLMPRMAKPCAPKLMQNTNSAKDLTLAPFN